MLLIKYMTEDFLFHKQLGWTRMHNNELEFAFLDLFAEGTACLSTDVELARYISFTCGNWDNYKSDDNIIAGVKENNDEDMSEGSPNNFYEFNSRYD